MGIGKKLAERTINIQASPDPERATARSDARLTTPGRLLDAQMHINAAEDRAAAATAEAEEAKRQAHEVRQQLEDARRRLETLQQGGSSPGAIDDVEISSLVEVPGRRRVLSPSEYEELRANLAKNDLVHPIVYRSLGDGKNEIVSGNNRVAIYRDDLGRTKIRGIPFSGDARSAELGATFSNLLAPSLPDYEKYRQFVRLQEESGFTRADILDASGLSTSHVSRILAFEKLPPAAREVIAKRPDRIGGHAAEEFAALASNGYAEAVVKAITALVDDESMTQKRALELAKPRSPRAVTQPTRTILVGKRKLCDVSVRSGVIGLRFNEKEADATVNEWAERIEKFIRDQLGVMSKE